MRVRNLVTALQQMDQDHLVIVEDSAIAYEPSIVEYKNLVIFTAGAPLPPDYDRPPNNAEQEIKHLGPDQ